MTVNIEQLKEFRRLLHANPELSGNEKETSESIVKFLKACKPDELIAGVGGFGIIAVWDSGNTGKEIMFRAELDALPIVEINDFGYRSKNPGLSHKCGHDGHSAILCGLAQHLSDNKPSAGKVILLFQPAEETGEGAKKIYEDDKFKTIKPDLIYALHNLPGYPLNEIVIKENIFTASVNSIIINLHGKTAHAAEPEHGINPALAVSEILREALSMENNQPEKDDMRVITPVYAEIGEKAYGISAGKASIHLTLRCWNDDNLKKLEKSIKDLSNRISDKYKLKTDFEYVQTFQANVNSPEATNILRKAAASLGYSITERNYPFKWGEDFGLFTSKFKGCMFGIGSGINIPELHNPDYDFPDEIIETGVNIFSEIITLVNS
ncbi:MAG: amidohydrolase [Ignavibacteria bacterium]|nr:amidohydrolase [Ignavibacteria bacterium]